MKERMCAGQTHGAKCDTACASKAGLPISSVFIRKLSPSEVGSWHSINGILPSLAYISMRTHVYIAMTRYAGSQLETSQLAGPLHINRLLMASNSTIHFYLETHLGVTNDQMAQEYLQGSLWKAILLA